ncbi:PfkB family carbohydrate kinase [Agriterribacter sp.]|uniref:bifunctional heptose 7-phosphate kinase/heptose 1-phosphate adenyltransferase n=1 Tax=Agriterribacter sp. TaxID=2821509 RepID=UPI002BADD551|nr:PfkB family carbohydrate kinase [Agriterribacter sp.]HRO46854.1 PfkB family carbohydrate kinase [Agriterribacter sp.]HRQ18067.1 PfkB family carbohydrate kinase [Agriterribacter sp.]
MNDVANLFESFKNIKVGIVGDVMLDTYMWGKVDRISPEAPVPVVAVNKKEYRIGGAGNVALNICSLGGKASVISVTGNDDDGNALQKMFTEQGIDTTFLLQSDKRITTNKIRVIGRNQQMMRLDQEVTGNLGYEDENRLILAVQHYIAQEKPQVIIIEDYNKGVLTELAIQKIIDLCRHNHIITAVDPKRKNFFAYKGVDIFKPNLKEAMEGLNIIAGNVDEQLLEDIHAALVEKLQHHISFITLSEKGVFYRQGNAGGIVPSHIRNIADVSGAGDTVIAVASLVYAATRNVKLMAETANIAGGLVCEIVGTAAINKEALLKECRLLLH